MTNKTKWTRCLQHVKQNFIWFGWAERDVYKPKSNWQSKHKFWEKIKIKIHSLLGLKLSPKLSQKPLIILQESNCCNLIFNTMILSVCPKKMMQVGWCEEQFWLLCVALSHTHTNTQTHTHTMDKSKWWQFYLQVGTIALNAFWWLHI